MRTTDYAAPTPPHTYDRAMRIAAAAVAASATALVFLVSGCSEDEPTPQEATASSVEAAVTSARSTAESLQERAGELWDQGKVNGFVAAYKAAYPTLAQGRSDEDISAILTETCSDISDGKSEDEVKSTLADRATNEGDKPSSMQIDTMYVLIRPLC
jgi:hypothetical protein